MAKRRGTRGTSNRQARASKAVRAKAAVRGSRRRGVARPVHSAEIDAIRQQIERTARRTPPRWNADPEDVRRSVLKLVLTLVELIRQLLERQAIRRMESGTLDARETEDVGLALMRLQETILDLARQFDISPDELNLDLGPIGKLM